MINPEYALFFDRDGQSAHNAPMRTLALLRWLLLFLLVMESSATYAQAMTSSVSGPTIGNPGGAALQYRSGYEWDGQSERADGRFLDRIRYTLNTGDKVQWRLFGNREDPGNGSAKVTDFNLELANQFFDAEADGFDGGTYTGVRLGIDDRTAHRARIVLIAQIPLERWRFRHNSIISHTFGANSTSGIGYETRWRVTYQLESEHRLGVEMFNGFGNLRTIRGWESGTHRAGPVLLGNLTERLSYQTGLLAGLSRSTPDLGAKFWLTYGL